MWKIIAVRGIISVNAMRPKHTSLCSVSGPFAFFERPEHITPRTPALNADHDDDCNPGGQLVGRMATGIFIISPSPMQINKFSIR